ncbi:glycoside hydrolase family 16 protein [Ceratobasidium sp. AG-Ba]|nr:glycoside hydrolase family 16 protein [Ceratobasidium sp. AG-Ba]
MGRRLRQLGVLGTLVLAHSAAAAPSPPSILSRVPLPSLGRLGERVSEVWKRGIRGTVGLQNRATSNDSANLWVVDTQYQGKSFFDGFDFYTDRDPTNGQVQYVDRDTAFNEGLAYVTSDGKAVMKVDNTTWLTAGQNRKSVRIQSQKRFNGGLFILDLQRSPHGCGTWPAFWTVGPNWPQGGEIDIFEGVHENTKNQATFHTADGCTITDPQNFTGNLLASDCSAFADNNAGCGLINDSAASFGAPFNAVGGGVFASRWDNNGVWIWFFHRSTIPNDIIQNTPTPELWGKPTALLSNSSCAPNRYFWDHQIVFDITFCGDWAGASYSDPANGCPGTCSDHVLDPGNFYVSIYEHYCIGLR